jgi:DNA-binding transcriptional MerR regulator
MPEGPVVRKAVRRQMIDLTKPVYPISVVRELTGLTERQIRYYDQRELVVPFRTNGGTRRYSMADVERLREIRDLMRDGFSVEDVHEHFERKARQLAREKRAHERYLAGPKYDDSHIHFRRAAITKAPLPRAGAQRAGTLLPTRDQKTLTVKASVLGGEQWVTPSKM